MLLLAADRLLFLTRLNADWGNLPINDAELCGSLSSLYRFLLRGTHTGGATVFENPPTSLRTSGVIHRGVLYNELAGCLFLARNVDDDLGSRLGGNFCRSTCGGIVLNFFIAVRPVATSRHLFFFFSDGLTDLHFGLGFDSISDSGNVLALGRTNFAVDYANTAFIVGVLNQLIVTRPSFRRSCGGRWFELLRQIIITVHQVRPNPAGSFTQPIDTNWHLPSPQP